MIKAESEMAFGDDERYRRWRDDRLELAQHAPTDCVELKSGRLRPAARAAIVDRCAKYNFVVYGRTPSSADDAISQLLSLTEALGLTRLDYTDTGCADGIARLQLSRGEGAEYIPYTNRALNWHTDGYYNAPSRQVRSFVLHCVSPAEQGGINQVLDSDLAYIALREHDRRFITALSRSDVLTIPANRDHNGELIRPARTGPVFRAEANGRHLHMRYTARSRHVEWVQDEIVKRATGFLSAYLAGHPPEVKTLQLEAGQGIIANNVLHNRSRYVDHDPARLYLRARFHERVPEC